MALGSFAHIGTTGGLQMSRQLYGDGNVVAHPLQVPAYAGAPVVIPAFHTFPKPTAPNVAEALNLNQVYPGYHVQS